MRDNEDDFSMYEDGGGFGGRFGGDAVSQNEQLANFIQPPPPPPAQPVGRAAINQQQQAALNPVQQPASPFGAAQPTQPAQPAQPPAPDYIDILSKQILGQNLTGKWTGEGFGSAEANAKDMAKILSGIGIQDIKDFGKTTKTGVDTDVQPDGQGGFINPATGKAVDPKLVKESFVSGGESGQDQTVYTAPVGTQEGWGNKKTGEFVPNTYSERQTGNFWGGTFQGKGNTGYGVQLDSQGNPVFYTQGASSNDLANIMKDLGPIGQIGLAVATGGMSLPAQLATNAAIQVLSGGDLKDVLKGTAMSYLGGAAGDLVSGAGGITEALGKTGTEIASNAAKQFVGSGGKVDPVQALLSSGLNAGLGNLTSDLDLGDMTPAQKNLLANSAIGLAKGQPLEKVLTNAAVSLAKGYKADDKNAFGPGSDEEFKDGLIPGYFQPGGEGYIDPNKEEQTVNQDEEPSSELLRMLNPYASDEQPTERTLPVEQESSITAPADMPQIQSDPMDILQFVGGEDNQQEPSERPEGDEMTVRQEPENIDSLLRELNPYLSDEEPAERTIPDERESDIKDDEVTPDTLPFDPKDILPELPTLPTTTPKTGTPAATKPATPAAPTTSSGMNLVNLLALLSAGQQPTQQTSMQDPYAHIKLMEDLFGSDIDLTPAGGNTAQRK